MNKLSQSKPLPSTTAGRSKRNIELSLLLAVFTLVLAGLFLVTVGKLASHSALPGSVNVNTADSGQLADTLGIPASTARLIVDSRDARRGHKFESIYELRHDKVLSGVDIGGAVPLLIAREPGEVIHDVVVGAIAFVIAFFLVHIVLRKAAPEGEPLLLPIVALLSGVGLIAVFTVQDPLRDTFVFATQASGVAIFGAVAMLVPLSRPFGRLILRRYLYAYAAAGIALVVMLILFGTGPGGVHLRLFGFEPVEVVKLLMVLFVVSFLADRRGLIGDSVDAIPRKQDFAPLIVIYMVALSLFKVMNDLGPAVLLFGTFIALLYLSTGRKIYAVAGVLLLILAGLAGYKLHMGFFATRVTMWLHPWKNPDPRGGQLADGLWGMATGGFFGSGLGLGQPGLMPRAGSDLVFATIGEELGLFGTGGLLIVYTILVMCGYRIAANARTEFDRLLAAGLTTLIGLQTMMIVGGVTGLVPLTGITLPFISFGSSSLVVDFFTIGLLLSVSQKNATTPGLDEPAKQWQDGLRILSVGTAAYFLILVFALKLVPIQLFASTQTALMKLNIPDRDGVARDHENPRLLAFAASIPRGDIEDRNGLILARDYAPSPFQGEGRGEVVPNPHRTLGVPPDSFPSRFGKGGEERAGVGPDSNLTSPFRGGAGGGVNGVSLLTPDGRARVYTGGPSVGLLLKAVEGDKGKGDPIGMNDLLRGYDDPADLLAWYRRRYLPGYKPPHGQDVRLTIDMNVQRIAYQSLKAHADAVIDPDTGKPLGRGAAVVMDSATGEVLAAVSCPSFDPSTLTVSRWSAMQTDSAGPLFNRWANGLYPPGSTFKIVTATAALQNGLGSQVVDCRHVNYGFHWTYRGVHYSHERVTDDTGMPPHGNIDLPGAIRVSCNVYYASVAVMMGADAIHKAAVDDFHLAHIPPAADFVEDLPDCGYGQARIQTTPLEMAGVAQAVANNGWQMPPVFVKPAGSNQGGGNQGHMAMSAADAQVLQNAMLSVTQSSGTAAGVFDGLPVQVAGKTGSAQNARGQKTHSWFIGYAPADRPAIAFACIVERGGFGRAAAGPVCRDIVRAAL